MSSLTQGSMCFPEPSLHCCDTAVRVQTNNYLKSPSPHPTSLGTVQLSLTHEIGSIGSFKSKLLDQFDHSNLNLVYACRDCNFVVLSCLVVRLQSSTSIFGYFLLTFVFGIGIRRILEAEAIVHACPISPTSNSQSAYKDLLWTEV